MRVRDKEHQSLSLEQLQELAHDFPNDQELGEEIRKIIAAATTNNPKGRRATSQYYQQDYDLKQEEFEAWQSRTNPSNPSER